MLNLAVLLEDAARRYPHATSTSEQLLAWGKDQMAAYKYPRIIEFVTELPMTSTGKILKRELAGR